MSALLKADSHSSKLTALASLLQWWSFHSLYGVPGSHHKPYTTVLSKDFESTWGVGRTCHRLCHFRLIHQVTWRQQHCSSAPLRNSHSAPLLSTGFVLQQLAMHRKVYLCPSERRNTGELESTANWGQQQFLGLQNYVGFTFYTPVNSDFHAVGGVATATVVSHHFCCLCHRDHLILS